MTQFQKDLKVPMHGAASKGIYNLFTTKRDMHLFCVGLRPSKGWRFNDVKKYFGVTGNKDKVNATIRDMANRALLGEYDNLK